MQKLVNQLGTPNETPNVKKQLDAKRTEVQNSIESTNDMFRRATDLCREGSPQEQVSNTRKYFPYLDSIYGSTHGSCVIEN